MGETWKAIKSVAIGAVIYAVVMLVAYLLLDADEKTLWVIVLVFFGMVADELKDIAGSIKTANYQSYRDEFLAKRARFCFRIAAWTFLTVAGMVLVSILGSCTTTDAKDTSRPAAAVEAAADPVLVASPPADEELTTLIRRATSVESPR